MWAALILCAMAVFQTWRVNDAREELANQEARDSIYFKDARALYIAHIQREDSITEALNKSEGLRASELVYHEQQEKAYRAENSRLKRQLAAVNTSFSSVPELDSIQLAMFGPAQGDSLHTIPLDYSRKLTGDALRLPIEQRIATLAEERYDSATAHYGRTLDSYRVDLEMSRQDNAADHETMSKMMKAAEKMQGVITDQDKKFRRKRTRERIVEGLIMVGVVILAL